jgi:ubiquinone/menaquinone biosynthesis C-methylase UbiE
MLMSNSPDISIWNMDLSGRDMVTNERLDYGVDSPGALIRDGDARKLDFQDDSFDVVVSSLALHNIREKAERDQAIRITGRLYWRLPFCHLLTATKPKNR